MEIAAALASLPPSLSPPPPASLLSLPRETRLVVVDGRMALANGQRKGSTGNRGRERERESTRKLGAIAGGEGGKRGEHAKSEALPLLPFLCLWDLDGMDGTRGGGGGGCSPGNGRDTMRMRMRRSSGSLVNVRTGHRSGEVNL